MREIRILQAYLDKQTGRKFKVWETKAQFENRDSERYEQISYSEVEK